MNEGEENLLHMEEENQKQKKAKALYEQNIIHEMEKLEVSDQKERNAYKEEINIQQEAENRKEREELEEERRNLFMRQRRQEYLQLNLIQREQNVLKKETGKN